MNTTMNTSKSLPSVLGLATIYDKDILLYCISQLMHRLRNKLPIGPRVRVPAYDLLVYTNRGTSGKDYDAFCVALKRLAGTRISTNIRTGNQLDLRGFGMIDTFHVHRKFGNKGRIQWVEITLSDWVFKAISADEVLTLHRDYFRLGKPLERRIYELGRKHCGRQKSWSVSVEILHKKSGSHGTLEKFRHRLKHIALHDHLPDYSLMSNEGNSSGGRRSGEQRRHRCRAAVSANGGSEVIERVPVLHTAGTGHGQ